MKKKQIVEMYHYVVKRYENNKVNKTNCYTCNNCGHITKTIDINAGVTPFMHKCENCDTGVGVSSFYHDIAPEQKHTVEWYRPSLAETLKLKSEILIHVLDGGLNFRNISPENQDSN